MNKKNKKLTQLFVILLIVLAMIILCAVFFDFIKNEIITKIQNFISMKNYKTYLGVLGINILLQMFFVPGISVFLLSIAYFTQDYLYSMLVIYPGCILISILSYIIGKLFLKHFKMKVIQNNIFY